MTSPTHLSMSHEGIVDRLRGCANGLFWPEARDAIAEIERLQRELSTARRAGLLEAAGYHDEKVAEIWNADPEQMTDAEKTARGVAYSVHIMAADAIRKLAEEA